MTPSQMLRKLKDLDELEKRMQTLKDPSPKIMAWITAERAKLQKGDIDATPSR